MMSSTANAPKRTFSLPGYVTASAFIAIGGFLNGYDTGAIGAATAMASFASTFGALSPTMRGFTVSLILLTGAVPSVFTGQLSDRFGRLQVVVAGALIFAVGAALQGGAYQLPMFLVGRALAGIGEGCWLSNMTVYICEIAPSARRGLLVALPQLGCTLGICAGWFTCYGSVHIPSSMSWRLPYVVQATLAVVLAAGCFRLPASPRWLLLHGKREQAIRELERLDYARSEAEKDILTSQQVAPSLSSLEGFLIIFRRGYRARTILAFFVLGMVQLSGIDGVLYYAPILFEQAGLTSEKATFLASGVSAILMLATTIPAFAFADRWGRRTSIISGGLGLSSCMLIIGSLYAANSVHPYGVGRWVVIVLIFVFALTYCATWGVVSKLYASEIQPANTRAAANCVAQGLNFFTNWLVAMITPIFLANSSFGAYFLFGFLALGTVAVLAAYAPETRGRSLESIQEAFQRPVMRSWKHHVRRLFSSAVSTSSSEDNPELRNLPQGAPVSIRSVDQSISIRRVESTV